MKLCPSCNRNYADDTLIFCLDDGANLSAAYDANVTWQIPGPRNTDPPVTEVMPPQYVPGYQDSGTRPAQPPTAAAPIPPTVQAAGATPPRFQPPPPMFQSAAPVAPNKSIAPWIIASALLAVVALGLVGVLGYVLLTSDRSGDRSDGSSNSNNTHLKSTPGNSNNDNSTGPGNDNTTNTNTNANTGDNGDWLAGVWYGSGSLPDGGTWSVRLTVAADSYTIEYPNNKCGGRLDLRSKTSTEAIFTEVITYGTDCDSGARIDIEKMSADQISLKWTFENTDIEVVSAILKRE